MLYEVITMNTRATKENISALEPDSLFVAEGSKAVVPQVDGIEKAVMAQDLLLGNVEAKDSIVVIGGGLVGSELALHLAQQGKKVTIVEALSDILSSGIKLPPMNEWMLRDLLAFNHVTLETSGFLAAVTDGGAVIKQGDQVKTIPCDQVAIAIGYRSLRPVFEELKFDYTHVYNLGDAREVRNIRAAVWDSYNFV